MYFTKPFKLLEQEYQKKVFILIFRDDANTKDKKFTINLCEYNKNGRYIRDIGTKYNFMIE